MAELYNLMKYYEKEFGEQPNIVGLALSSRKNLCVNPSVSIISMCSSLCITSVSTLLYHMNVQQCVLPSVSLLWASYITSVCSSFCILWVCSSFCITSVHPVPHLCVHPSVSHKCVQPSISHLRHICVPILYHMFVYPLSYLCVHPSVSHLCAHPFVSHHN